MLETGIRDTLLADDDVTAKVGRRVRPLALAQDDARPYLTYHVTDGSPVATLEQPGDDDYRNAEFEVGIFADTYADVIDLSAAVTAALDQYGGTVSGVEFAPVMFDNQTDIEQATPEGAELPVYLRVVTFRALYKLTN